jgi:hypothetical protein
MSPAVRHSLVHEAVIAGRNVVEKSASATPAQREVIAAGLPDRRTVELSKRASLAHVLATGQMIEEAE